MDNNEIKYYAVTCKCGHVGKNRYIPIMFAIWAHDGKEAASLARKIGRVKHHRKDAIVDCRKVSFEEFVVILADNHKDPYLHCKNKQEQNKIEGLEERIVEEKQKGGKRRSKRKEKPFRLKKYEALDSYTSRYLLQFSY